MAQLKLKKDRIALERIKKTNLLASTENKYDYEDYKFKVIELGEEVKDKSLKDQIIIKQAKLGIEIEHEGKTIIIVREDDILAII